MTWIVLLAKLRIGRRVRLVLEALTRESSEVSKISNILYERGEGVHSESNENMNQEILA